MKKVIIFIFMLCLLGCSVKESVESQQFNEYDQMKDVLINKKSFDQTYDFDVSLYYTQIEQKYRYDIVIHNPTQDMYHIKAMAYTSENDEQMCPSLGVFDDDVYHLKANYINKEEGYYKGVHLSGTTNIKQNVKLYVCYYSDIDETNKIEKYIEVKA